MMALVRGYVVGHLVYCDICGRILGEGVHTYEARSAALITGNETRPGRWVCKLHDWSTDYEPSPEVEEGIPL